MGATEDFSTGPPETTSKTRGFQKIEWQQRVADGHPVVAHAFSLLLPFDCLFKEPRGKGIRERRRKSTSGQSRKNRSAETPEESKQRGKKPAREREERERKKEVRPR